MKHSNVQTRTSVSKTCRPLKQTEHKGHTTADTTKQLRLEHNQVSSVRARRHCLHATLRDTGEHRGQLIQTTNEGRVVTVHRRGFAVQSAQDGVDNRVTACCKKKIMEGWTTMMHTEGECSQTEGEAHASKRKDTSMGFRVHEAHAVIEGQGGVVSIEVHQ